MCHYKVCFSFIIVLVNALLLIAGEDGSSSDKRRGKSVDETTGLSSIKKIFIY